MARRLLWCLAGLSVIGLVGAELTRPLASDVDPVAASTFLGGRAIAVALDYRVPLRWAAVLSVTLRAVTAIVVLVWLRRRSVRSAGPADAATASGHSLPLRQSLKVGLVGVGVWIAADLVRLPLGIWGWNHAVQYGLSTQDFGGWLGDWALQTVPYWIGVWIAVAAAVWIRHRWPRDWVAIAGLIAGVIGVVLVVLSPLVFEPLLFDFTPLPQGRLRTGIQELVDAADNGRDAEILVADASRRTTASNAYVSGIGGTRRIVLYDTLIRDAPQAQILTIVAHELGHDQHHDVERTAVQLVGVAVLLAATVNLIVGRPSADDRRLADSATVAKGVAVVMLLLVATGPIVQWSSRRAESAADAASLELTGAPQDYRAMMIGLAMRNLSDPDPPAWIIDLFFSHPPVTSRIARATGGG
ncbi:MAG: M48 family metalloprotease [Euzebya sp.]